MLSSYYAARANLYTLHQRHPEWSHAELAAALGSSTSWVEKWLKRFREELAQAIPLEHILQGHSRARKTPSPTTLPEVVQEILAIRDPPPEGLRRVPGPEAIHYYLARDPLMLFFQLPLPSCKTIYRILKVNDRIALRKQPIHEPVERPAPMSCWQIDFKDVSTVPADPDGKRQHVVETLNVIDVGTSVLLDAHVRSDFTAETALQALASTLAKHGRPQQITLDRDPRWVGSPAGSDFPAALIRFGACLGIDIQICAPHHPQQNGFVERYHRSYQEECLALDRPETLEQASLVTQTFVQHYNKERPHQGLACGNQPPLTAFPSLPSLPALPPIVDPDSWLNQLDGLHLERKVDRHGMVSLDLKRYYVSSHLVGHHLVLHLDAQRRCVHILHEQCLIKEIPLRGLVGHALSFEQFLTHMLHQARAQARLRSLQERRYRMAAVASP
ncbi:transposase family protein [Ktedonobacteria bacterium brp13]|nr:transposase family protein [Ktedonobacteria bacterium brp13]